MVKQLLFLFVVIATLSSCTGNTKNSTYTIDELMSTIETQVGQEVKVSGTVNHVCKHAGRKCFIVNENEDLSLQIMAGGIIKSFDNDLVGTKIEAVGVVKEHRVEKEQIDEREKTAQDLMQEEESSHEQCQAMLNNVAQMREWMNKNKKDYYAIYYIDGIKYKSL